MFTGIIEVTGTVVTASPRGGARLAIDAGPLAAGLRLGASVAVNGVCLTAGHIDGPRVEFDVIKETLDRSTLGGLRPGQRINLERSLAVGDRLDGHFVQGHVDGRATVRRRIDNSREFVLWLAAEDHLARFLVPKGSVAVDGVSLTIAEARGPDFSVALIPTTLKRTTLGDRREGDLVNIESDILARMVVHLMGLAPASAGLTLSKLAEVGYA